MENFLKNQHQLSCEYVIVPGVTQYCKNEGNNSTCNCGRKSVDDKEEIEEFPTASEVYDFNKKFLSSYLLDWCVMVEDETKGNFVEELDLLMDKLLVCSNGVVLGSECLFEDLLTKFFTRMFKSSEYQTWRLDLQKSSFKLCVKLIELIALQIPSDSLPLLNILPVAFDPHSGMYGGSKSDNQNSSMLLVNLLNHFGKSGGFKNIYKRFHTGNDPSNQITIRLLFPFIKCNHLLSPHVLSDCFMPIVKKLLKPLRIGDHLTVTVLLALLKPFAAEYITIDTVDTHIIMILSLVYTIINNLSSKEQIFKGKDISAKALNLLYRAAKSYETEEELIAITKHFLVEILNLSGFVKWTALLHINRIIDNPKFGLSATDLCSWMECIDILKLSFVNLPFEDNHPHWEELEKLIIFKIRMKNLSSVDLDKIWAMYDCKYKFAPYVQSLLVNVSPFLDLKQYDYLYEKGFRLL